MNEERERAARAEVRHQNDFGFYITIPDCHERPYLSTLWSDVHYGDGYPTRAAAEAALAAERARVGVGTASGGGERTEVAARLAEIEARADAVESLFNNARDDVPWLLARIAELTARPCGDPQTMFTAGSLRRAAFAGYHAAMGQRELMEVEIQAAHDAEHEWREILQRTPSIGVQAQLVEAKARIAALEAELAGLRAG